MYCGNKIFFPTEKVDLSRSGTVCLHVRTSDFWFMLLMALKEDQKGGLWGVFFPTPLPFLSLTP